MTRQLLIAFAILASSSLAYADLSKEACVDAHSRGQDARDSGKITLARKLFLTCAQSGCPAAVQGDCARFADDLSNLQPTVNFVARDGNGNDLPNTSVYVDGMLVATSIDGRPVDVDPGNHTVKFSNAGKDEVVTVVIGSGEKGRVVQARFGSATIVSNPGGGIVDRPAPKKQGPTVVHPKGALAVAIAGGVLALAGGGVVFYGRSQMPSQCDLSTHECAAPPGDKVFGEASSAASTINLGYATAGVGVAVLAGGLVWYFAGAKTIKESSEQQAVAPWVNANGGGVAVMGRF
ncbi:MAG TPA: hypothetical protein VFV99_15925 [Kofleriaceae bacterium]|nr:hypothetical protein [Kofleriaceae bacterium]